MRNALVIGIGNRHRGDDAAGPLVAEALKGAFETLEHDGEPASLIDLWEKRKNIILVDAVSSGASPGTLSFFDLQKQKLPDIFGQTSTHAFGVAEAVELARALGKLPLSIAFYGIEGNDFSVGGDVSPEVIKSVEKIVTQIKEKFRA